MNFDLHHFMHQIRVEFMISLSPHSSNFYAAIGMLIFAVAFFVVGLVRLVEWKGLGFSKTKRVTFSILQVFGSILCACGFALFAIDPLGHHKTLLSELIGAGFLILFPLQIYLALVRRVRNPATTSSRVK